MRDLVGLTGAPGPQFVADLRRCWDAGDAVLPIDHRLPPAAVAELLAALRPTIVDGGRRPDGRPVEDGDAIVLATSGTTGRPKGVVLTHDAVAAAARVTSDALEVDPTTDHWLCCLPVAHAGGLGVVTRAVLTGTRLTILPGFDVDDVVGAGATLTSLVATALRRVDPARWRCILLGGDAPPAEVPGNAIVTYGMTETGGGCVYDGRPLSGVEVRVDADGQIWLRGPLLARAYRAAADDVALTDRDGWYATGDSGAVGEDGVLRVDGRIDDVIVTGGEKVWPAVVEAALRTCPGVAQVAVVGRPDPKWGQCVVAVVVPALSPPTLRALRDHAKQTLPAWAAPHAMELVDSLPTTALGKVRRRAL